MLDKELGAEPSAETMAAYERLVSGDGRVADAAREPREVSPTLVGRQGEWARLRSAWNEGARERLHFALIAGEAGIGKSRLAEELLGFAQAQGIAAARSRAYEAEGRLSLAPISEWLRSPAFRPHVARLEG